MFVLKTLIFCAAWLAVTSQGQYGPTTTPVPILKQINRQNDDGSYSFGYEAADGSFKIETKYPSGDVAGKYGYVDETGKLREISYGASSQRGFEPEGPGIMVPPPTLHDPSSTNALTDGQEDDGQYREDPSIYEDPKYNGRAHSRPSQSFRQYQPQTQTQVQPAPAQYHAQAPTQYRAQPPAARIQSFHTSQPQQTQYQAPQYTQQSSLLDRAPQQFPQQDNRPQSQVYHQQPQFSYQAYTPQPYQGFQNQQYQNQNYQNQNYQNQNYQSQNYSPYAGHPAQNFDPNTGSYSINYTGK